MTSALQNTVTFNVGGEKYTISKSLLENFPETMLSAAASKEWHEDQDQEIFIDRNGRRFQFVLDYLRDGKITLPMHETKDAIATELEFYNIEVDMDCIHFSKEGPSANGIHQLQHAVLYWRCADLAADLMNSFWAEQNWRGGGNKKYLSFRPLRFKECSTLKQKEIIRCLNDFLLKVGVEVTSIEFDRPLQQVRATVQLADISTWQYLS